MTTSPLRAITLTSSLVLTLAISACSSSAQSTASAGGSGGSGVTGTVTFDGAPVEPFDDLSCLKVEGNARIAGSVGDGGFLKLQSGSATYEDGEVHWTSTSGDNKGDLEVTSDGASGTILMYDTDSDTASSDQEFVELIADLSC